MICRLVRKDIGWLLKKPLTYLGIAFMFMLILYMTSPYWDLYGGVRSDEMPTVYDDEGDIIDGYVPCPKEETWEHAHQKIKEVLISDCGLSETEAIAEIEKIEKNHWNVEQTAAYFKENYSLNGIRSTYAEYSYKLLNKTEMQAFLSDLFSEKRYTENFAYKYSDALGIALILFTVFIFVLIMAKDLKKDMYAMLHTKQIRGAEYIVSKVLAGTGLVGILLILMTLIMEIGTIYVGKTNGFQVGIWDIPKKVIFLNLPAIMLTGSLMIFIALLFRSIIPTIPAMLLYFVYSNMGSIDTAQGYIYQVKKLVLFIRFPQSFGELAMPNGALTYVIGAVIISILLICVSIFLWERRRGA